MNPIMTKHPIYRDSMTHIMPWMVPPTSKIVRTSAVETEGLTSRPRKQVTAADQNPHNYMIYFTARAHVTTFIPNARQAPYAASKK